MTRADLEQDGPAIRLSALVRLSGFSRHKLYADIERGDLRAFRRRCGRLQYWYVERYAASEYLSVLDDHQLAS
jgi:hypothetical protein